MYAEGGIFAGLLTRTRPAAVPRVSYAGSVDSTSKVASSSPDR
jgi:hypothetical protein